MIRLRAAVLLLLFTLIAFAMTACDRQQSGTTSTPPAAEGPHRSGQAVVAILTDVSTFNEYLSLGDTFEMQMFDLLFPTLMTEQNDYLLHPPSFAPRLATSWEFSQDNKILTFHLRPDARWSDGVPVTADDVRFTYLVQKSPEVGAPGLEIKDFITDVEVVDPLTVRFHFSRVYPYQLMDANDGHIIPKHAWSKVPFAKWPTTDFEPILVTCGPFRLASHTRGQTIVLERDPGYWGNPKPYLDRIVFRVIRDATSQINQLLAGEVQLVELVPPREADRIRANPTTELIVYPSRRWGFIAWNNRHPLFSDRRVRRALSLAINRTSLVETVYHGFARVATGPVLSSMWAYNKNLRPLPFDPAQARALFAEAGWTDTNGDGTLERNGTPFAFDLLYPAGNPIRQDIAVLVQADLARVGVVCRPLQVEATALLGRLESGAFDASLAAWDEATKVELTSVWATPSAKEGSNNFCGYSNPEVDRLIAAARDEPDYTRAKFLLDRIQELIVDDQPVTFLYEADALVGISRRIRGADINAGSVFFNVEDWYWGPP